MLPLSELFKSLSQADVMSSLIAIAQSLNLPATSWQSGAIVRGVLATIAKLVANYTQTTSTMNRGGFLGYAQGAWLDVLALAVYNVTRFQATPATTTVTIVNASATTYTNQAIGSWHFVNPSTGITYTNTVAFTLNGSSTLTGLAIQADTIGSAGNASPNAINALVTSLAGVTVTNPGVAIGNDAEVDGNDGAGNITGGLSARCILKLGALSPVGPKSAYDYFARTVNPTGSVPVSSGSITQPSQPATKTLVTTDPTTGNVVTTVANAGGAYANTRTGGLTSSVTQLLNNGSGGVRITTATPHGLVTTDTAWVSLISALAYANGLWTVTRIDALNVDLVGLAVGSTGAGQLGTIALQGDLDLIDKSIQANAVPLAVTATTQSATPQTQAVTYTAYVPASSGLTAAQVTTAVAAALTAYIATFPIGGITAATPNLLPAADVWSVIWSALPRGSTVALATPAADVAVGGIAILSLGTITGTVNFV